MGAPRRGCDLTCSVSVEEDVESFRRNGVAVRMDNLGFSERARGVRCEAADETIP